MSHAGRQARRIHVSVSAPRLRAIRRSGPTTRVSTSCFRSQEERRRGPFRPHPSGDPAPRVVPWGRGAKATSSSSHGRACRVYVGGDGARLAGTYTVLGRGRVRDDPTRSRLCASPIQGRVAVSPSPASRAQGGRL